MGIHHIGRVVGGTAGYADEIGPAEVVSSRLCQKS